MGIYDRFEEHLIRLGHQGCRQWATTYSEIEKLTGQRLKPSARQYRAFWNWQNTDEYGVRGALRRARWKIEAHSKNSESLTFVYMG